MAQLKIRQAEGCDDPQSLLWDSVWDPAKGLADWALAGNEPGNVGGLRASAALHSAVMICLFTDKRVPENHALRYLAGDDRRGWWGDVVDVRSDLGEREMGSLWWLLERAPLTAEIARWASHEGQVALAPLIQQGAAVRSEVVVEINEARGRLEADVRLFAVDGSRVFDRRFESLWDQTR